MKRKLKVLSMLIITLFAANVNAQDFGTDTLRIYSNTNDTGDVMIIPQGETKRLVGNISVISKQQAQNHANATNMSYIYQVISGDLDYLYNEEKPAFRDDTLFVCADTLRIERQDKTLNEGTLRRLMSISTYSDGQWHNFIISTIGTGSFLENIIDNDVQKAIKKNSKSKLSDWEIYATLGFGYGYTGWSTSNSSLFSTPSDNYSTKWSNKWDIMLNFNFKVNSIPVWPSIGIGFHSNVFRFDEPLTDVFTGVIPQGNISDEKFSLCANYITFPIMINYHPFKHFTVHAGAVCGVNVRNSSTGYRYSYKVNGEKVEQSTGTSFKDFNSFKWDAFLGVEVYGWTLYVTHALTPIFKDSYNKDLYPFAFGVMLGI